MILSVYEELKPHQIHDAVIDAYFERCILVVEGSKTYRVSHKKLGRKVRKIKVT